MSKPSLVLPLDSSSLKLLHFFVTGAAKEAGLDYEDLEDLRFVLSDLITSLLQENYRRGSVKVSFETSDDIFFLSLELPRRFVCLMDREITCVLFQCLLDNYDWVATRRGVVVRLIKHVASQK